MKAFTKEFHPEPPVFAALASLREIFRDLVAAPPLWALRGKISFLDRSQRFTRPLFNAAGTATNFLQKVNNQKR